MKRAIAILVILAMLGGLGWKVYQKLSATKSLDAKKAVASVAVEVAPVRQATIHDVAPFTGTLAARSEFVVAPKVAGRLVKLLADIGDEVKNDQLIAVLDDEEYSQQVAQAEAELEVVKASVEEARGNLDAAQSEFDRVEALRAKKIASESELDEARSQYRTALARHKVALSLITQKEASLRAAQVRLSYTQIRARWSVGSDTRLVGERFANTGAMLPANEPIVSVVDIEDLTAVIHVTEGNYAKVQVGQTVDITCDAYEKPFTGHVVRVAPLVKEASREARVEVNVVNTDRLLRPGMFIRARIELARHENATVVPEAAIAKRQEKEGVFVADLAKKTATFVPVVRGIEEADLVQVVEPALHGYVVTLGQHLLEDGMSISLPEMDEPAGKAAASRPAASQPAQTAQVGAEART
jgi:RND family efflux transporter MFP subunit